MVVVTGVSSRGGMEGRLIDLVVERVLKICYCGGHGREDKEDRDSSGDGDGGR